MTRKRRTPSSSPRSRRPPPTWLTELEPVLQAQQLLTLPYGDLDLAGAADHDPALIELAGTQVSTTLDEWGLTGTPVVGSPSGYLTPEAIDDDATRTRRCSCPTAPSTVTRPASPRSTDASWSSPPAGASAGGPAPGNRVTGVALRQRILSEAALRVLEPGRRDPLVVVMPAGLTSLGAEEFFAGLDVDWVDLTTLTDRDSAHRPQGRHRRPGLPRAPGRCSSSTRRRSRLPTA